MWRWRASVGSSSRSTAGHGLEFPVCERLRIRKATNARNQNRDEKKGERRIIFGRLGARSEKRGSMNSSVEIFRVCSDERGKIEERERERFVRNPILSRITSAIGYSFLAFLP